MEAVDSFRLPRGRSIEIYYEPYPINPRKEYNYFRARLYHWHPNYDLCDEKVDRPYNHAELVQIILSRVKHSFDVTDAEYREADDLEGDLWAVENDGNDGDAIIKRMEKFIHRVAIIMPLYLYDHSGISLSTSSFSDRWDSGQVGFAVLLKKTFAKECGGFKGRWTAKQVARAHAVITSEVEEYDQYLTGDVYGFIIKDKDGNETDSCWGFYGDNPWENGIFGYAITKTETRYLVRTKQTRRPKNKRR